MTSPRMIPSERLDIDVAVQIDVAWWPGSLETRRQRGDTWEGFVRGSTAPGETRIGWYGYDVIRIAG